MYFPTFAKVRDKPAESHSVLAKRRFEKEIFDVAKYSPKKMVFRCTSAAYSQMVSSASSMKNLELMVMRECVHFGMINQ